MEILPVAGEFLRADGQPDNRFSQFYEST